MIDVKELEVIQTELSDLYIRTKGNAAFVDPSYIYDYVEQLVELCYHMSIKLYEQNMKIEAFERDYNHHYHIYSDTWGHKIAT